MLVFAAAVELSAACGGGSPTSEPPSAMMTSATLGPDGGTIATKGVTVVVPPGALSGDVTFTVQSPPDLAGRGPK